MKCVCLLYGFCIRVTVPFWLHTFKLTRSDSSTIPPSMLEVVQEQLGMLEDRMLEHVKHQGTVLEIEMRQRKNNILQGTQ